MSHIEDYQIRWKNFRAYKDTGWITIRPLTILIGPNNSGKTSILGPLLLMSQTVRSPDASTPLITRGPLMDAGAPEHMIHNGDLSKPIYFGFKFHLHTPDRKTKPVGAYPPGVIELTFDADRKNHELKLKQFSLSDVYSRHFLTKIRKKKGVYELRSDCFPKMKKTEIEVVAQTPPTNFLFSPSTTLLVGQTGENERRRLSEDFSTGFSRYLNCLSFVFGELNSIFRGLTYVGPHRERSARFYEVSGERPIAVGVSGEQMANMIRRQKPEIRKKIDYWIERFEFGKRLEVRSSQDGMIFSLMLNSGAANANSQNIADSGFGVSQVLPLIVQSLAAGEETLTIAEQPEIHLNPRLQCTLADLFVEMANTDHRVIVETHSEHLLLRLRRLIASGKISHKKVAIYYIEKDGEGASIREVKIENDGSVDAKDWPKGFFADTLRESLGLAEDQAVGRKQSAKKKRGARNV